MFPHKNVEFFHTTPFMNVEKVNLPDGSMPCVVYDLSGQGRYRHAWQFFYAQVDGIVFVVDCSDKERLYIVSETLEEMARHPNLINRKIPFIILANKQDEDDSIDSEQLRRFIQLDKLK